VGAKGLAMNAHSFDALAKIFARGLSRRQILHGAGVGGLGATLVAGLATEPVRGALAQAAASASAEDEVRQASDRFYAALNRAVNGDPGPMADVWSHQPDVTALHPYGGREVGWNQVWASWQQTALDTSNGKVTVSDLLVRLEGGFAYTVGLVHIDALAQTQPVCFDARVTTIFRREAGAWKMVHLHTDANQVACKG
jgi:ketosteroid isomerase-like protein